MTDEQKIEWFKRSVKFQLDGLIFLVMKTRKHPKEYWTIEDMRQKKVLNSNLEWEPEPPNPAKDEAFWIRTRFDFETAVAMYEQYKMFAQQ